MSVISNNQLAGAAGQGGAAGYEIKRSLRFNDDDTAHLSNTFSAGNRKTWTWSGWVKRSKLSGEANFFSVGASSTDASFRFNDDDTLKVTDGGSGELVTNAQFRDPSAWYHIVLALDNTQSTNTDRFKLYVNGVEQTYSSASYSAQNTDSDYNTAVAHYFGRQVHNTSNLFDGYLADVHWIDGQQLAPTDFGEYDDNNVWQPKEFTGSHNASGFTPGANISYGSWADVFNGSTTGHAFTYTSSGTGTSTATLSPGIAWSSKFRIYGLQYTTSHVKINGGSALTGFSDTAAWVDVTSQVGSSGTLSSVQISDVGTNYFKLFAIELDDTILDLSQAGVNGFHLDFSDNSSVSALGTDSSGESNTWTCNNFSVSSGSGNDSLIDTPTNYEATGSGNPGGNYCTWNPLDEVNATLSNGNLDCSLPANGSNYSRGTFAVTSGKWYWEVTLNSGDHGMIGISDQNYTDNAISYTNGALFYYVSNGSIYGDVGRTGGASSYGSALSANDVLGVALDMDNGNVKFYKNGTAFTGNANTSSLVGKTISPILGEGGGAMTTSTNFGQRSFAISSVPSGYKALCTANLPDPGIADSSTVFAVKTFNSNDSSQSISLGFSPDLVWTKSRANAYNHQLFDRVRGNNQEMRVDTADVDRSLANSLTFDSSGFTMPSNNNNANYGSNSAAVAWAWDAGTSSTSVSAGGLNSSLYNTSRTWSSSITTTGNSGNWHSSYPATNAFNGNDSNYAHGNGDGSTAAVVTLTFSPAISASSSVSFRGGVTSSGAGTIAINGGTATNLVTTGTDPAATDITTVSFSGSITSITISKTSTGSQGLLVYGFDIDGKRLIDNGTTVTDIPSLASTYYANPSAGLSVIGYTGNGTTGSTIAHGLNSAPEFVVFKNRDDTMNWYVYHKSTGHEKYLTLDRDHGATDNDFLNDTAPTSSVITLKNTAEVNANTQDIMSYAWTSVSGYSSFGSYRGNGSTDGAFVYTGFRPKWLLLKHSSDAYHWYIFDSSRDTDNVVGAALIPNEHYAETSDAASYGVDFVSNGFKLRNSNVRSNNSGTTYIYAAFAEHPFASNGGIAR